MYTGSNKVAASAIELIDHNIATNKSAYPRVDLQSLILDWDDCDLPPLALGSIDLIMYVVALWLFFVWQSTILVQYGRRDLQYSIIPFTCPHSGQTSSVITIACKRLVPLHCSGIQATRPFGKDTLDYATQY